MMSSLDPSLLQMTKEVQENLREAERRLDGARRDFETAVRRLYVEGASTREIALAMNLSHQRVHQLTGAKPHTWWQQLMGGVNEPPRGCSFCGKAAKSVAKLVAGPGVHICDACLEAAGSVLAGDETPRRGSHFELLGAQSRQRCSFCGKRSRETPRATRSGHQICGRCVELAQGIVAEHHRE